VRFDACPLPLPEVWRRFVLRASRASLYSALKK